MDTSVPSGSSNVTERRKKPDRRDFNNRKDARSKCQRRVNPDRRVNSISVEWIPFSDAQKHPVSRFMFSRR